VTTSSPAILALDQGTHASRALLFSAAGELLDAAVRPVGLVDFGDGRVEQDGGELLASLQAAMDEVVAGFSGQIEAAGLVTQRSTLVAWDRIGVKPLAPAIGWQDRRAVSGNYGARSRK